MSKRTINQLHDVSSRFLRSAQLERDFDDPDALAGYVVTNEVKQHLNRIGEGLKPNSALRSWRITGDFGSGKSSFALVLANLLGRSKKQLPSHVKALVDELNLSKQSKPFLPILVTGARESLSQALLDAFALVLKDRSETCSEWKSAKKLKKLAAEKVCPSDKKIINAIGAVCRDAVESKSFGGVILVLDELGKFLEFSAMYPQKQDIFFLQQLAELSSRSGDAPLLTLGLLHQGFSAYASKLSHAGQKEWEKIGGRFEGVNFAQPMTQVAALIAAALNVDHDTVIKGWKGDARLAMRESIELGIFGGASGKTELCDIAVNLYPLHPTILPIISRFFRRFGQNERSLFSFLFSTEPHGLNSFGERKASRHSIYRLADFYDYAAENFAHKLSEQSFKSHWLHVESIVCEHEGRDEETLLVLKTIGILNVVESDNIRPTRELLAIALPDLTSLDEILKKLVKRSVLFNRGGRRGYALWSNTSVNLEQAFTDAADKILSIHSVAEIAEKYLDTRPIVARRHYIQSGTLRHFVVNYLSVDELVKLQPNGKSEYPADGSIFVVLCEKLDDRNRAVEFIESFGASESTLIAVSPPLESLHGLAVDLARWAWIESNVVELKDDRFAAAEVANQVSLITESMRSWLDLHLNIRNTSTSTQGKISWYYRGVESEVMKNGEPLQSYLSTLCSDTLFSSAPIAKNELINRHLISSSAAGARQRLFEYMLEKESVADFGFEADKAPPEKSIYLSVLQAGHVHTETNGKWSIGFPDAKKDPCNLLPALNAVMQKLEEEPDSRVNLSDIYDVLRSPDFGVRDGMIPLLLLIVFITHESEIAVYEDDVFQAEVEPFLMMRLCKAPQTFEFQLCRINSLRRDLVDQLAGVLSGGKGSRGDVLSIVRPLCLFIANLPEYSQHTDRLSSNSLKLRKVIENADEPSELVFKGIPTALGFDVDNIDTVELTKKFKSSVFELRRSFPELQERMSSDILDAFSADGESLESWRNSIADQAEIVVMGLTDASLRAFCMKLIDNNSEQKEWLESLGSLVCRKPSSKWRDRDELVFKDKIVLLAGQFNRVLTTYFDENGSLPESAIRLSVTPRSGEERDLVISLSEAKKKQADVLRNSLSKLLTKSSDKNVALAAVSRVVWDLLEE